MGSLTFTNSGAGRKARQIFLAQQQEVLTAQNGPIYLRTLTYITQLLLGKTFIRNSSALINDKATFQSYKPNKLFSQTSFPLLMQTMNPDDARQIQQLLKVSEGFIHVLTKDRFSSC